MIKKLLALILAAMLVLCCFIGLIACGENEENDGENTKIDGVYYMYIKSPDDTEWRKEDAIQFEFKEGKLIVHQDSDITDDMENTYTIKSNKVIITTTYDGLTATQELEIVSDGILKAMQNFIYYCKDGKTPPENSDGEIDNIT